MLIENAELTCASHSTHVNAERPLEKINSDQPEFIGQNHENSSFFLRMRAEQVQIAIIDSSFKLMLMETYIYCEIEISRMHAESEC